MGNFPIALIIAVLSFIGTMLSAAGSTSFIVFGAAYLTSMIILIGSGFTKHIFKGEN